MKGKRGVVIAGLSGGSGKSVVAVGITAALAREKSHVSVFKKGPDYIDGGWLQSASGRNCYNLDPYLMSQERILASYNERSLGASYVVVEGNRGLYDGVDVTGGYSTAELAKTLNLPVLLVVNCTKITRTVAALVLGCQKFDKDVNIVGVVLNQIATRRQRKIITDSIEKYTDLHVFGIIPRLKEDIFPMRHLGMVPYQEYTNSQGAISSLAGLVEENIDLDAVKNSMAQVPEHEDIVCLVQKDASIKKVTIGVIQDSAFQFYYAENLEALEKSGAHLVYINAMSDKELPEIDGLYIGGGFPETSARELSDNVSFRESVKKAADEGMVIYAECGGLIYLGESIVLDDTEYKLAGVFQTKFTMQKKPQAHGYTILRVEHENPFYKVGTEIKGHEFRYSKIVNGVDNQLVFAMERGTGFSEKRDGLLYNNVLALYTHIHADGTCEWATSFVASCLKNKK